MRTIYLIIFLLAISTTNIIAQRGNKMSSEQLESQKIAFITTKLELTPEESRNFWPVYIEYSKNLEEIKKTHRPNIKLEELTEESAEKLVMGSIKSAEAELRLKKEYTSHLKEVISMKKIAKLYIVEHEFKRQMLMRLKERRNFKKEKTKN